MLREIGKLPALVRSAAGCRQMEAGKMRRGFGGAGRQLARFIEDRSGNFAVITAAILTTILLSVGFGINTAQMVLTRSNLLNALDSAVTSTARDLTTGAIPEDDAEKTVKAFLF